MDRCADAPLRFARTLLRTCRGDGAAGFVCQRTSAGDEKSKPTSEPRPLPAKIAGLRPGLERQDRQLEADRAPMFSLVQ